MVYRLYDTFGFPVDITDEMAREDGLFLDMPGFEKALEGQKERSRADRRSKHEILADRATNMMLEKALQLDVFSVMSKPVDMNILRCSWTSSAL